MTSMTENTTADDVNDAADEVVHDIKRGAKRVGRAIADGADAVDDALRPSFGTQLADALKSIGEDPASTPELTRDLVRDHPLASLATAAAVGVIVAKGIRLLRR